MIRNNFLYRSLGKVVLICCVLCVTACASERDEIANENATMETEVLEVVTTTEEPTLNESTENVTESETQAQEDETEYLAEEKASSWVADLDIAETANQIIVVAADGSDATVSMHQKDADGTWTEILNTPGKIGRNGIGKTKEGDGKTPTGVYRFTFGFGNMPNPGCGLSYTQVDDSYYWVDDSESAYYNQFVTTNEVTKDWNSAEHIAGVTSSYNYVLALDYNSECVPGKGSAIFMHCTPTGGAGCIAVAEEKMVEIIQKVDDGCLVVIDSVEGVKGY